jgi:hypothetical protein
VFSNDGSLKRRVRSQLARGEMKNCTPLWREAHFQVKMYKTHQLRSTFRSCDVEKVHAVVARRTFPSQNVQNTPTSEHFWKLRCWKVHGVAARSTFRRGADVFFDLFFFFLFFLWFSVWGTFSCYFLHFGAKRSTLLNLGPKICHLHCSSSFPWRWLIYPQRSSIFHGFHWVCHGFNSFFHNSNRFFHA